MSKVVGYCRLSRDIQDGKITLIQQEERLKAAGAEEIYTEVVSGTKNDRPQFLKVLDLAKKGEISKIICVRLDRYGRDGEQIISTVLSLHKIGVKFQFLDDPDVDLDSTSGMMMLFIKAGLSQQYSIDLSKKVKNGINHLKAQNAPISSAPFGYKNDKKSRKFVLDTTPFINGKSKAEIAREMIEAFFELRTAKAAIDKINRKYNTQILHPSMGHKWLRNYVLRGHTVYNKVFNNKQIRDISEWDVRYNTHPDAALLSPEEAEIVDIYLDLSASSNGNERPYTEEDIKKSRTYFTGILYCANCNKKLTPRMSSSAKKYRYFFCRNSLCSHQACVREDKVNYATIVTILKRAHSLTDEDPIPVVSKSPELDKLERELEEIEVAIAASPTNSYLKKAKEDCLRKIQDEQHLSELDDGISKKTAQEIIRHPAIKSLGFLENLDVSDRRLIYYKLIKNIMVIGKEVKEVNLTV